MSWDKDFPAAEGFCLHLVLAGTGGQGALIPWRPCRPLGPPPVAAAKFIVLPGNEPDKVVIEGNAIPGIEDGRVGVTVKGPRDKLVLSVTQDALEGASLMSLSLPY